MYNIRDRKQIMVNLVSYNLYFNEFFVTFFFFFLELSSRIILQKINDFKSVTIFIILDLLWHVLKLFDLSETFFVSFL